MTRYQQSINQSGRGYGHPQQAPHEDPQFPFSVGFGPDPPLLPASPSSSQGRPEYERNELPTQGHDQPGRYYKAAHSDAQRQSYHDANGEFVGYQNQGPSASSVRDAGYIMERYLADRVSGSDVQGRFFQSAYKRVKPVETPQYKYDIELAERARSRSPIIGRENWSDVSRNPQRLLDRNKEVLTRENQLHYERRRRQRQGDARMPRGHVEAYDERRYVLQALSESRPVQLREHQQPPPEYIPGADPPSNNTSPGRHHDRGRQNRYP